MGILRIGVKLAFPTVVTSIADLDDINGTIRHIFHLDVDVLGEKIITKDQSWLYVWECQSHRTNAISFRGTVFQRIPKDGFKSGPVGVARICPFGFEMLKPPDGLITYTQTELDQMHEYNSLSSRATFVRKQKERVEKEREEFSKAAQDSILELLQEEGKWFAIEDLVMALEYSRSKVYNELRVLLKLGEIEIAPGGGRGKRSRYRYIQD
jgi:hypothetical protein